MNTRTKTRYLGYILVNSILLIGFCIVFIFITVDKIKMLKGGQKVSGVIFRIKVIGSGSKTYFIKFMEEGFAKKDSIIVTINSSSDVGGIGDSVTFYYLADTESAELESEIGFNFSYWVWAIAILLLLILLVITIRFPNFFVQFGKGEIGSTS